ncbi:MAG: hypothetical protein ACXW0Q_00005 [Methylovulum sp.]
MSDELPEQNDQAQLVDARRYQLLRHMAMKYGRLEKFVACEQLDFIVESDRFDAAVDEGILQMVDAEARERIA